MKTARLFQNGKSQAVRIPSEFKFEGEPADILELTTCLSLLMLAILRQRSSQTTAAILKASIV